MPISPRAMCTEIKSCGLRKVQCLCPEVYLFPRHSISVGIHRIAIFFHGETVELSDRQVYRVKGIVYLRMFLNLINILAHNAICVHFLVLQP